MSRVTGGRRRAVSGKQRSTFVPSMLRLALGAVFLGRMMPLAGAADAPLVPKRPPAADRSSRCIRVLNRGVGGNTSRDGLARFDRDVVAAHPDHLVLFFGMNDACNSAKLVPVDQFERNLQAMIDRSPTSSIVLVSLNPIIADYVAARHPRHPFRGSLQQHLAKYDAAVRRLARRNHLPLADLRKLIETRGGASLQCDSLIRNEKNSGARDGVHLTADGYRLLAGRVAEQLRGRVQPGDVVLCFGDSLTFGAHVRGAGTATGETYPAWVGRLLNRTLSR
ncbi:MAG: hypothetical protein GXP27_17990 [Planctomycetes bacterium]|nr:hypothetical protein [Planctomycetota bacterium]